MSGLKIEPKSEPYMACDAPNDDDDDDAAAAAAAGEDAGDSDDEFSFGAFAWIEPRAAAPPALESAQVPLPLPLLPVAEPAPPPAAAAEPQRAKIVVRLSNSAAVAGSAESGFAPWLRDNFSMQIVKHKNERSRSDLNRAVRADFRALDAETKAAFARRLVREQRPATRNRANSNNLCK
jgi:hypothetical protein